MLHGRQDEITGFRCVCGILGCAGADFCQLSGVDASPDIRALARGERLIDDPTARMRFRIVRSGVIAACAMTADGRRQIVSFKFPGDAVCPMSVDGSECWCEALAPTEICELDLAADGARPQHDAQFSGILFRLLHEGLARSAAQVVVLGQLDSMERLCWFLAEMARRIGRRGNSGIVVQLPMSREDIGDYLGLNADTVSRLLTRIKNAGLVQFRSIGEYEVNCLDELKERFPIGLSGTFDAHLPPCGAIC